MILLTIYGNINIRQKLFYGGQPTLLLGNFFHLTLGINLANISSVTFIIGHTYLNFKKFSIFKKCIYNIIIFIILLLVFT